MKSLQIIEYADKESRANICRQIIQRAKRNKLSDELRLSLDKERSSLLSELERALNFCS